MADYQLAATELAMACHRNSLGRTTPEVFARHRDDSLSLMRAAAEVVRAREPLYVPPWLCPDPRAAVGGAGGGVGAPGAAVRAAVAGPGRAIGLPQAHRTAARPSHARMN